MTKETMVTKIKVNENLILCYNEHGTLYRVEHPLDNVYIDIIAKSRFWYKNGALHRDNDLPAIEYASGEKHWLKYGYLHRTNGPALIYEDGSCQYWEDGIFLKKSYI